MAALFASGLIADLILGLVALEAVGLSVYWWRSGRGVPPVDLVINLASGACLLLALRSVLMHQSWQATAAWLAAALAAHIADLARRWR